MIIDRSKISIWAAAGLVVAVGFWSQPAYAQTKPIAHYPLNEGEGHFVTDISINQLDGVALGSTWAASENGSALSFHKEGGVAIDQNGPADLLGDLQHGSISVWFLVRNLESAGGGVMPIFYFGSDHPEDELSDPPVLNSHATIEIGHTSRDKIFLYFTVVLHNQVVQCFDSRNDVDLENDTWYHFVGVVGPKGNTGYLNGNEMIKHYNSGTGPDDVEFFATVPPEERRLISLGYGTSSVTEWFESFDGKIDDVRIYDRPLSAGEVWNIYVQKRM